MASSIYLEILVKEVLGNVKNKKFEKYLRVFWRNMTMLNNKISLLLMSGKHLRYLNSETNRF